MIIMTEKLTEDYENYGSSGTVIETKTSINFYICL